MTSEDLHKKLFNIKQKLAQHYDDASLTNLIDIQHYIGSLKDGLVNSISREIELHIILNKPHLMPLERVIEMYFQDAPLYYVAQKFAERILMDRIPKQIALHKIEVKGLETRLLITFE